MNITFLLMYHMNKMDRAPGSYGTPDIVLKKDDLIVSM